MKLKHFCAMAMAVGVMAACGDGAEKKNEASPIDVRLTEAEIAAGILTPEVMYKMGRIGAHRVSPDGERVVFAAAWYSVPENRSETALYIVEKGEEPKRITDYQGNDTAPRWSADGRTVYFLSDRSGERQLWRADPCGGNMRRISDIGGGIDGYGVAPDGSRAFYTKKVRVTQQESADVFPDLPKSRALIYDDLMVRHWNRWNRGDFSHIFIAEMRDGRMQEGVDIMPGEPWDAPMSPYFNIREIAWSNNSLMLAYTCKKLTGREYALSTDSDIYLYDTRTGLTTNLTPEMPGYDKYPVFSPDDTQIAFMSMRRPVNEADKQRLFVMNIDGSNKRYLTEGFDYHADYITWIGDDTLLFQAPIEGTHQLVRVGTAGGPVVITAGDHDINEFSVGGGGRIVAGVTRLTRPTELYDIDPATGAMERLTDINAHVYEHVRMGRVEKRWITTTDNKQMLTWIVYPPDFDPARKYPALLYCQGGPQSTVSQSWSYRWNFQLMAAQGYIVVAPNRRGVPSFGSEWLDQISGDYSGQNIRDYLSAIDNVAREPFVDAARLGCIGASYGGYSAFYLAGIHNGRFKAFISHNGIFNFESMYGSTEELFFVTNDYGGPYWDTSNPVAQRSYANSPHTLVARWDTPILITGGLLDFRVPYTQALEAFTAARVREIPSRLVLFEDEAHQIFKPQNAMAWNREFFGWLGEYLIN
ncbi:MAG: S9 family peptidase [Rikenellaceae bacterium]|nr:S9 family peptidase [Rikenellaceae bacterium]MCL2692199.1 S9 family peptidase [Rikenellaceae bacterium]